MSLKKIILFLLALSICACSTYQMVDIEILISSSYQVKPTVQGIIVSNYALKQDSNIGHTTYKQDLAFNSSNTRKKKVSRDTILVDSLTSAAVNHMYHQLVESTVFESVKIGHEDPRSPTSLRTLVKIVQTNPNSIMLLLDSLTYTDDLTHFYRRNEEPTDTELRVRTRSQWLVYYTDSTTAPYHFATNQTLYWDQIDTTRAACIREAILSNTKLAAGRITPQWSTIERLYYPSTKLIDNKVAEAIAKKDWAQTGPLWMSLYTSDSKNTKQKGRMAYNMALFFEMRNNIETALMWLDTAIEIFTEKDAQDELKTCARYVTVLNNCLLNKEKLDQQYKH